VFTSSFNQPLNPATQFLIFVLTPVYNGSCVMNQKITQVIIAYIGGIEHGRFTLGVVVLNTSELIGIDMLRIIFL